MAYVTRTHGERPHAEFQLPTMTSLAMHKEHTRGQNKGNANIYVDFFHFLVKNRIYAVFWFGFGSVDRTSWFGRTTEPHRTTQFGRTRTRTRTVRSTTKRYQMWTFLFKK